MIATAERTIAERAGRVVKRGRELMRVSDRLRDEAAKEVEVAFEGVSTKKIRAAGVPGAGASYISRVRNGCQSNPLFRLASLFYLGRILGVPKWRFQRILDWLQRKLDEAYADAEVRPLEDVLAEDQEHDPEDDVLRWRASRGCLESARRLLDVKRRERAHDAVVIAALEAHLAAVEAR